MKKIQNNHTIECRICKNKKNNREIIAKETTIGSGVYYLYILCSDCKSLSIADIPKDLDLLYAKYPNLAAPYQNISTFKKVLKRYLIKNNNFLSRLIMLYFNQHKDLPLNSLQGKVICRNSKILDVGCGNGYFVRELADSGFQNVIGIDQHLKHEVKKQTYQLLQKSTIDLNQTFDLIIFNHSFEHIANIKTYVKTEIEPFLNPNGLLIIRMPNIQSWSFWHFKEYWDGIHAPYHINLPSYQGMKIIFGDTNLKLIENRHEQLLEMFINNVNTSLDIGLCDEYGLVTFLKKNKKLFNRMPLFTKSEINHWKSKINQVKKCNVTDYIVYYYRKAEK